MPTRGPNHTVTNERILIEFILNGDPALFASEVEPNLPLTRQQINNRLDEMAEEGLVYDKHASGRRLWWISQKGRERVAKAAREALDS